MQYCKNTKYYNYRAILSLVSSKWRYIRSITMARWLRNQSCGRFLSSSCSSQIWQELGVSTALGHQEGSDHGLFHWIHVAHHFSVLWSGLLVRFNSGGRHRGVLTRDSTPGIKETIKHFNLLTAVQTQPIQITHTVQGFSFTYFHSRCSLGFWLPQWIWGRPPRAWRHLLLVVELLPSSLRPLTEY